MRAMVLVSARPMCAQVLPPSADLKTPTPAWELRKMLCSPVPTQTMSWSDGRQGDVADGRRDHVLEDGRPGRALVLGLPDAAGGRGHVDRVVLALGGDDGDVGHPAADVRRADELPLEVLELRGGLHGLVLLEALEPELGVRRLEDLGLGFALVWPKGKAARTRTAAATAHADFRTGDLRETDIGHLLRGSRSLTIMKYVRGLSMRLIGQRRAARGRGIMDGNACQ